MAKDKNNIEDVVARYLAGQMTEEDREILEAWLAESGKKRSLLRQVKNDKWMREELAKMYQIDESAAFAKFKEQHPLVESPVVAASRSSRYSWKMIAAAVLILVAAGWWFTSNHKTTRPDIAGIEDASQKKQNDVDPGGNKAILKLADGSIIVLDHAANGILSTQGNALVRKTDAGKLVVETSNTSSSASVVYNTISTPRGGQYQITLPDGTRAWLNAGSSLYYPSAFTGTERRVTITGEAFFDVAKVNLPKSNTRMPFIVTIQTPAGKAGEVEVLGTQFNITAYGDEPTINTTLLEGSVALRNEGSRVKLVPGQQGQLPLSAPSGKIAVRTVDTEKEIAWKNGKFMFTGDTIEEVMRQVERWYDVKVQIDGAIADRHFVATISRDIPVSKLLKILGLTGDVNFTVEGRKIIVTR